MLSCRKSKQKELDLRQRISVPVPADVYTTPMTKRQLFSNPLSSVNVLLGKMWPYIYPYILDLFDAR